MKDTVKKYKAALFDMDGLMIDSEPLQLEAVNIALADTGVVLDKVEWSKRVGIKSIETFIELKKQFGFIEEVEKLEQKKCTIYEEIMSEKLALMKGVRESIHNFKGAGFKLAVASSSTTHHIELVLNKFSLIEEFDEIVSGEQVLKGKPNPDIFIMTAKKLGVENENCVVIEDTIHGVTAAKSCGMLAIGIPNEFTQHQDFSQADFRLMNLLEITPKFISDLNHK